jgi:hypothetical protein
MFIHAYSRPAQSSSKLSVLCGAVLDCRARSFKHSIWQRSSLGSVQRLELLVLNLHCFLAVSEPQDELPLGIPLRRYTDLYAMDVVPYESVMLAAVQVCAVV